ncbi:NF038215 family lipoprotein [Acinetobacter faecalis]|uniref:NF038215 family lipoprotein n=1 Tax=Acinetobacter faecalis TaxID=2665161 RepID=UPI002A910C03|nr:NF038215 family lipoprotein [Acinetobacter faecalis]MDY6456575.1 NF038215 family lipoprotein [Acinetobacter faecalis]
MKYTTLVLMTFGLLNIVACDTQQTAQQHKTESRTMFIGGVPAHDKDYKVDKLENTQEKQK